MIDRPTEDADLFTTSQDVTEFGADVAQVTERLRERGYIVDQARRAPRSRVCTGPPATGSSSTSTWGSTGARTARCTLAAARC